MKKIFFLLIISCIIFFQGYAQDLSWAKQAGGTEKDNGVSIVTDAAGNVYTCGMFSGIADFDPGAGVLNLTSAGFEDIFITKTSSSGSLIWAKQFEGAGHDFVYSTTIDAAGNLYTTGYFSGTADFDPGSGVHNLVAVSAEAQIFVSKLDANGNFLWAGQMGGLLGGFGKSVVTDATGNVFISGEFFGTTDFDPGSGVFELTANNDLGLFRRDMFICKLDAAGNFLWAKNFGGPDSELNYTLSLDAGGNIILNGRFINTADFDPGPGVSNFSATGIFDGYIVKLDAAGNFIWARQFSGNQRTVTLVCLVDNAGNIYCSGYFQGTVDFDPGPAVLNFTSAGSYDIFISKFDADGNLTWAKQIGGVSVDALFHAALDGSGNIYFTGYFYDVVDFDPGAGSTNLTANGDDVDGYISKFDANGNFLWVKQLQGDGLSYIVPQWITVDVAGNIYTTGYFYQTIDFDPGAGTANLTSIPDNEDIFMQKLTPSAILPVTLTEFYTNCVNNVLTLHWHTESESNFQYYEVQSSNDGINFSVIGKVNSRINSNLPIDYTFADNSLISQKKYYRLKLVDNDGRYKFSKIITGSCNDQNAAVFSVYPNPATEIINIRLSPTEKSTFTIQVADQLGKIIYSAEVYASRGASITHQINTSGFSNGVYLVTVNEKDKRYTHKIIISR